MKILYKVIVVCDDCPYCEYQHCYGSVPARYGCGNIDKVIINTEDMTDEDMCVGITIPNWCPLANMEKE